MSVTIISGSSCPVHTWCDGTIHSRPQAHDTPDTCARAEAIASMIGPRIVGIIFDSAGVSQIAGIVAECIKEYDAAHPFRAGDVVLHLLSGSVWVLACDQERHAGSRASYPFTDGACVWPETDDPNARARANDCEIITRVGDDERLMMLRATAAQPGEQGAIARRQLEGRP
jgi:hypothetical protein